LAPESSRPILNEIVNQASAFICISEGLVNDVESFLNRKLLNPYIIPIPLNKIYETPLEIGSKSSTQFLFTNIAFLHFRKRHEVLIRAFKKAFDGNTYYKLNIVGDGPEYNNLSQLILDLNMQENVFLVGKKKPEDVLIILNNSHASVLSSKDETLGVVVYEALSRGIPVVATRCGGPEYILKDFCGILVEPDNIEELAFAMTSIVTNYSKYKIDLIRSYAITNFGNESYCNSIEKLLK
jgi:glycosyltransferase involved in cell wall biosynthesis